MHGCVQCLLLDHNPAITPHKQIDFVTHSGHGGVGEAGLDADDTAGQHTAQAVGAEA
jgi:hypothetical protein